MGLTASFSSNPLLPDFLHKSSISSKAIETIVRIERHKKLCRIPYILFVAYNRPMLDIPEQLKWYTPLGLKNSHNELGTAWRVLVDQTTSCVEIKCAPLIRLSAVLAGFFLGAFTTGGLFVVGNYDPVTDDTSVFFIFLPLMIVVLVSLDAFTTLVDSRYWKGSLRFRFNPQNGELFFPRENMTYGAGDYAKIVLGCVHGTEVIAFKGIRVWWAGKFVARARSTQLFMLVLDQNGEWKRYNFSDDHDSDFKKWKTSESGSKQFFQLADLLRQHLSFETFVKDYSLDECYEQQR